MATKASRPGRVLVVLGLVILALYGGAAAAGNWKPRLGLDLQGGTRITLQAKALNGQSVSTDKLNEAKGIIEQRVNGTGVSEAAVSTQGGDQIIVEIPGQDRQGIVDQVGRTAQLRFRLVWASAPGSPTGTIPQTPLIIKPTSSASSPPPTSVAPTSGAPTTKPTTKPTAKPTTKPTAKPTSKPSTKPTAKNRAASAWMLRGKPGKPKTTKPTKPAPTSGPTTAPTSGPTTAPTSGPTTAPTSGPTTAPTSGPTGGATSGTPSSDWSKVTLDQSVAISNSAAQSATGSGTPPSGYEAAFGALTAKMGSFVCPASGAAPIVNDIPDQPLITCDTNGTRFLLSPAVIEGTDLNSASAGIPQNGVSWAVNLALNGTATDVFANISQQMVQSGAGGGGLFAIVLDGQVISAPGFTSAINDGNAQITGNFNQDSANALANSLKYGALPLTFEINGVTVEGPSLAGSSLKAGILAGLVGLALVVVYCLFYYRGLGLVVVASLVVAASITYACVLLLGASLGFTLTLPGIAGLIVAVGITADSFIVFFERLRDEVRDGKSLRLAVEAGWRRARTTILAADAVSFLAALVLYIFAIGVVRGFAFALGLTTIIDVFVVFLFTKPLVSLLARTRFFGQGHRLSGFDARHLGIEGRNVSQMARLARKES